MNKLLKRLYKEEEGASLVEYGLLVGGIAVVCIVAIFAMGDQIATYFDDIKDALIDRPTE